MYPARFTLHLPRNVQLSKIINPLKNLNPRSTMVGVPGIEPGTSSLSGTRSNQLSYTPIYALGILVRKGCDSLQSLRQGFTLPLRLRRACSLERR